MTDSRVADRETLGVDRHEQTCPQLTSRQEWRIVEATPLTRL
jgi:hypothetical protein